MRLWFILFLIATYASAQGIPPPRAIDKWDSAKNQTRLLLNNDALPSDKPGKNPDGSEEPAKAPWPFVIYVWETPSKSTAKIDRNIIKDAYVALASHLCPIIRVKPEPAINLKYLSGVQIKDPTIIVIDRNFKIVGALKSAKDFTYKKYMPLVAKAIDRDYEGMKCGRYLGSYRKILEEAEKLWKEERRIEDLTERGGKKSKADQKAMFKEIEKLEKALLAKEDVLLDKEEALKAGIRIKAEKEEAIATTVGTGRNKRELTPEEIEAIKAFKQFSRDKNPIVRAAAVEDLGAIDSAVIVAYILKATNDTEMRVVLAAGRGLGKMKSEESLAAMHAAIQGGKDKRVVAALIGFSLTKPYAPAVPDIIAKLQRGSADVRRRAMEALVIQRDPVAVPPLIEVLGGGNVALKVIAALALGDMKDKRAVPALLATLDAGDWSLRKAAAEALEQIRAKESIEPLLQRFKVEDGRMKEVIHDVLVGLTGQDFKYRFESWERWWKRYGSSFKVPTAAEIKAKRAKLRDLMKGYAKPGARKYHRIETISKKLIFIIDISASMKDKILIPDDAPAWVHERYPDRVRMEIAKKGLITMLDGLEPNVFFNVITFAGRVKSWQSGLVSGSSKTAAIKFVAKLKPMSSGGRRSSGEAQKTNTYGALLAAFGLADEAVPNWKRRTKVDTIFMVTDGVPTTGEIIEPPKLVRAITDMNRARGVTIHLVCFDKIAARQLSGIATNNGGQVVIVPDYGQDEKKK
ncbi:MAG: HEAT repeat domain-containing protein [Planctomycetota bacterium]